MKFHDKKTGGTLTTRNPFNIEQYRKYKDRFEEIEETEGTEESAEKTPEETDDEGEKSDPESDDPTERQKILDELNGKEADELTTYAKQNNIDIGRATSKATILRIITEVLTARGE